MGPGGAARRFNEGTRHLSSGLRYLETAGGKGADGDVQVGNHGPVGMESGCPKKPLTKGRGEAWRKKVGQQGPRANERQGRAKMENHNVWAPRRGKAVDG